MKARNKSILTAITIVTSIIIVLLIMLSFFTRRSAQKTNQQYQSQQANGDMVYGDIGSNVANQLKHQLDNAKTELEDTKDQVKELTSELKQTIEQNKKDTASSDSVKDKRLWDKLEAIEKKANEQQQAYARLQSTVSKAESMPVGKGDNTETKTTNKITWIKDEAVELEEQEEALNKTKGFFKSKSTLSAINKNSEEEKKPKPAFTIPDSTILTGVTTMTNLVGRIPKGDEHNVFAPYESLFHVDLDNLTAKNFRLPKELADLTGRAVCIGDFMSSSVSCKVITINYIFKDGTISTVKAKDTSGINFSGLGYFTDANGRTQIDGKLVSSLGIRLGSTALTGGVSGLGAGIAQSGLAAPTGGGFMPFNAVSNIGLFAAGQGINQAAGGFNKEFQDFNKNLFDYVVADNWDRQTKALKKFNIVITQQINIDYDPKGRKLDHHLVSSGSKYTGRIF